MAWFPSDGGAGGHGSAGSARADDEAGGDELRRSTPMMADRAAARAGHRLDVLEVDVVGERSVPGAAARSWPRGRSAEARSARRSEARCVAGARRRERGLDRAAQRRRRRPRRRRTSTRERRLVPLDVHVPARRRSSRAASVPVARQRVAEARARRRWDRAAPRSRPGGPCDRRERCVVAAPDEQVAGRERRSACPSARDDGAVRQRERAPVGREQVTSARPGKCEDGVGEVDASPSPRSAPVRGRRRAAGRCRARWRTAPSSETATAGRSAAVGGDVAPDAAAAPRSARHRGAAQRVDERGERHQASTPEARRGASVSGAMAVLTPSSASLSGGVGSPSVGMSPSSVGSSSPSRPRPASASRSGARSAPRSSIGGGGAGGSTYWRRRDAVAERRRRCRSPPRQLEPLDEHLLELGRVVMSATKASGRRALNGSRDAVEEVVALVVAVQRAARSRPPGCAAPRS